MKLGNEENKIISKRRVYYVTIYNSSKEMVGFLTSPNTFVSCRPDATFFSTEEEAEELRQCAENSGLANLIKDFSHMNVSRDTQYYIARWGF